ncbi:MAG: hypothetical protein HYS65_10180 [Betaproteobacteria bacterium]|nr:hypothetical protein [Betaproteobacteria bacterium]
MKKLLIAAAAVLLLGAPVTMLAQDYPNQPVRLIVGFAAGGSGDIVARIVAQLLAPLLGQPVVVENKPGAGGMIGADFVAKAPPDGHTLLLLPSGHATGAAIRKKLPFEPVQDFAWITTITTYPFIIATRPESQLKSLADLIARAKAQPGSISYSSVGVGSAGHLLGEWFSAEGRIQLLHVPFRGGTTPLIEVQTGRASKRGGCTHSRSRRASRWISFPTYRSQRRPCRDTCSSPGSESPHPRQRPLPWSSGSTASCTACSASPTCKSDFPI